MILRFVFFLLTTLSGLLILSNLFIDGPFHSHPVKVTFVWTHEESGVMKYLQWLATRRLANIRLTRWNDQCADARETFFSTNVTDRILIQVYLMPSINHSHCSSRMNELVQRHGSTRIYFTRRSLKAITTLPSAHWRIIYAEDLIERQFNAMRIQADQVSLPLRSGDRPRATESGCGARFVPVYCRCHMVGSVGRRRVE